MKKFKLTDTEIKKLPFTEKGKQTDYYDSELDGFGLRVSATGKKYFVRALIGGRRVRVMMKSVQLVSAKDAREEAKIQLGTMAAGTDPNQVEREKTRQDEERRLAEKQQGITLQEVYATYLEKRQLKPRSIQTIESLFKLYLVDWMSKPIQDITKQMISDRHGMIAKGTRSRELVKRAGDEKPMRKAAADNCLRALRTVLNFHQGDDDTYQNPVKILSRRKEWYKVDGRRTLIKNKDLPAWHKAVVNLDNTIMRDYLLFLLFTGLRRQEAATLKWKQVDFEDACFTIVDTKNKSPHSLPLSGYLHTLLTDRKEGLKTELTEAKAALAKIGTMSLRDQQTAHNRVALAESRLASPFVFPGEGHTGFIVEPKRAIDSVIEATGINFSCHDLRRTFATLAESLDLSRFTVKALLNHKQQAGDVTAGYIILNVDRLREPMQKITDALLERTKTQHGQVIQGNFAGKAAL
jgi:integrase